MNKYEEGQHSRIFTTRNAIVHPKYTKGPVPNNPISVDSKTSMLLRITLGEMALDDAFQIDFRYEQELSLRQLLATMFPTNSQSQQSIRHLLDTKSHPDIQEMYEALVELFTHWHGNRCDLRFYVNHGPELSLDTHEADFVKGNGTDNILDIVIEQTYSPLEYAVHQGYYHDVDSIHKWLSETTTLYFISRSPESLDITGDSPLIAAAQGLHYQGYLSLHGIEAELTESGERHLKRLVIEAASYANKYDVFADTLLGTNAETVRFGTGQGIDLRVPIYRTAGIDPIRAVFLLRMYDSSLEQEAAPDWRQVVADPDFYQRFLVSVADHLDIDSDALDLVVESGFKGPEHTEKQVP